MPRLRRSDLAGDGIRRIGTVRMRYVDSDGRPVRNAQTLTRIAALVIPPAWIDVWISPDELGHIQAMGTDQAGRRQYLYHEVWRVRRDRVKFDRAVILAETLPSARRTVTRDLDSTDFSGARCRAAAFRIIDLSSLRIGSEEYLRSNRSRGLTTLLCRHVTVTKSDVVFVFPAKSGREWRSSITDLGLAEYLRAVKSARGPQSRMLSWRDTRWHALTTSIVNDDIRSRTGAELTAKDFAHCAARLLQLPPSHRAVWRMLPRKPLFSRAPCAKRQMLSATRRLLHARATSILGSSTDIAPAR